MVFFDGVESGEMLDFSGFARSGYRTRKWGFRRGNNRYALSGFRLPVLKCKPRPTYDTKDNIIVQYYGIFLSDPLYNLL